MFKNIFLNIFHFFGKIRYFAFFKYFKNILPIFRNYCEKKEEKPFFEQLFTVFSSYPRLVILVKV